MVVLVIVLLYVVVVMIIFMVSLVVVNFRYFCFYVWSEFFFKVLEFCYIKLF